MLQLDKYKDVAVECEKTSCVALVHQIFNEQRDNSYVVPEKIDLRTPKSTWMDWVKDNRMELLSPANDPEEWDLVLVQIGAYPSVLIYAGDGLMFGQLAGRPSAYISFDRWRSRVSGLIRERSGEGLINTDLSLSPLV